MKKNKLFIWFSCLLVAFIMFVSFGVSVSANSMDEEFDDLEFVIDYNNEQYYSLDYINYDMHFKMFDVATQNFHSNYLIRGYNATTDYPLNNRTSWEDGVILNGYTNNVGDINLVRYNTLLNASQRQLYFRSQIDYNNNDLYIYSLTLRAHNFLLPSDIYLYDSFGYYFKDSAYNNVLSNIYIRVSYTDGLSDKAFTHSLQQNAFTSGDLVNLPFEWYDNVVYIKNIEITIYPLVTYTTKMFIDYSLMNLDRWEYYSDTLPNVYKHNIIELNDIELDFGQSLLSSTNSFMQFQLLPNFTLFNLLLIVVAVPILIYILKLFLGG